MSETAVVPADGEVATAAASGAGATARFLADKQIVAAADQERVDRLASRIITAITDTVAEEKVTYEEYNALKSWLIKVGEDGEWPLFLDVWVEHSVEEVANADREGSKGTIEGPYYVPDAPEQHSPAAIEMRDGESGEPFVFAGRIRSTDGTPLAGAKLELWHADSEGYYSQFAPGIPEWNLRGTFLTDDEGRFEITTVQPAPYQIPTEGACGQLIAAAGWHAWRPAHFHYKASAEGHQLLTAQLYFPGDPHNDDDIATAVKPELMLDVQETDGGRRAEYDIVLDPAK